MVSNYVVSRVWNGDSGSFYNREQETAAATEVTEERAQGVKAIKAVKWKANALRQSYASYRFALTNDAGRVAGEAVEAGCNCSPVAP
jgi:hypothetical protein